MGYPMNTGHGIALAGLFIGMGMCIHAGAYLGATWLLLLYIAGWIFVGQAETASVESKAKLDHAEGAPAADSSSQS